MNSELEGYNSVINTILVLL